MAPRIVHAKDSRSLPQFDADHGDGTVVVSAQRGSQQRATTDRCKPTPLTRVGCAAGLCGFNLDDFAEGSRRGNWKATAPKILYMKLNGFADQRYRFGLCLGSGYAPGQIRNIRSKGRWTFFDHYEIAHFLVSYFFSPACLRALLSVPDGTSIPGFPATVTVPGLFGWWYCR